MPGPRSTAAPPRRAPRERRSRTWLRRLPSQPVLLLGLLALLAAYVVLTVVVPSPVVPPSGVVVVLLLGGFFLRLRWLLVLMLAAAAALAYSATRHVIVPSVLALVALTALLVLLHARSRERLGVQGNLGESMLVDLRDRLRAQGVEPPLPRGWGLQKALKSAYGDAFSGDFVVFSVTDDERWFEAVVVDVSGKGQRAGTRALLLSGAFGGLLGAMPREEFLPAANRYLLRQDWDEGFATAIHLALDLRTGQWRLAGAGHPPALRYFAGSGRWVPLEGEQGPALGLLADEPYPAQVGTLGRGDAILLYTDGMVETPGRDLALGIDRLMGHAEKLVMRGFDEGATWLMRAVHAAEGDDRAMVLIWRR